ncbi:MAG: FAD-dependent oxidoreductase, partial [Bradyrhizobium sp.]
FYAGEGHVEPRQMLPQLHARFAATGGALRFNSDTDPRACDGIVIDCRGLAARDSQPGLRGVKGEMIVIETDEVELSRPVRLIHPRFPLYVIPRGDGRFMLGATSIEAEHEGVSVRSALELLGAAYAVHPAFAEARIVEFGAGLRPAFPDNLPRIAIDQHSIAVNGLFRHGFLLAPALAELTLGYVERGVIDNEVMRCA